MIQFITQGNNVSEHLEFAYRAMDNGIRWVQLRLKDVPEEELKEAAARFLELCKGYRATACLNDHAQIAAELGFAAIHLGKNDETPEQARKRFHREVLIGGTANNMDDIHRINSVVDYIGLGPFRFTTTKSALSPVLGENGYRDILQNTRVPQTPVIAIGGIRADDVAALADTGIHGVAISRYLIDADFNQKIIRQMQHAFSGTQIIDTWID